MFHQAALSLPASKWDTCCDVCGGKSQIRKLTPYNKCTRANAYTLKTRVYTSTQKYNSQEMVVIHFVRCKRTHFGSVPRLMSGSLMCKSSGPSARLIRSPYKPAQVQPCSLQQCLSCVPNTIWPPTANKPISKRKKYAPTYKLAEQKNEENKEEKQVEECHGHWDAVLISLPYGNQTSIITLVINMYSNKYKSLVNFLSQVLLHRIIGLWLHRHVLCEMNAY